MKKIDLIVPLYNEAQGIPLLYENFKKLAQEEQGFLFRFLFVNDGSTDGSLPSLLGLQKQDERVRVLDLSRNFGQHKAITAGLKYSTGDCAVILDADMEDNPRHVLQFLKKWSEGWEVVYALRGKRHVSWLKGLAFRLFHVLNRWLSGIPMESAGTFALLDRRVVEILNELPEKNRYIPGLRTWAGFRQIGIALDREPRYDSNPRVQPWTLVRLAMDSFVSFSTAPLQLASLIGFLCAGISFVGIIPVLALRLTIGLDPKGWTSLVLLILLMSGIQLICLGVIGEYIGRILEEAKGRPNYVIRGRHGFKDGEISPV